MESIKRHFILASAITSCTSISAFLPLVCIPFDRTSSVVGLKICAITAGIKKHKSVIRKKKKKKHDKIVLLGKETIEVLISKTLIGSHISYDEFVSANNVLKKYNEIKMK